MSRWHKSEFDFYPEAAFQRRAGGGMTLEGGGSSSSSNATDTYQTDRRIANDSGLVIGGDVGKFDASTTANVSTSLANSGNTTTTNTNTLTDSGNSNSSVNNSGNSTTDSHNVITDGGAFKTVTAGVDAVTGSVNKLLDTAGTMFKTASDNQSGSFSDLLHASTDQNSQVLTLAGRTVDNQNSAFDKLVNVAGKLFDSSKAQNESFQTSVAGAYRSSVAEKAGALDNKTIVILGVAAAAAVAAFAFRKG